IFRDNKDATDGLYDLERVVPTNTVILDLKNNLFEVAYAETGAKVTAAKNYVYSSSGSLFASINPADVNFLQLVEGQGTERGDNGLATTAGLLVGIDLLGNSRLMHSNIDLGAYEFQGVLPVTFDYFTAVKAGSTAKLTWKTLAETNSSHFLIERGSSPSNFTFLTRQNASGTTVVPSIYNYVDQNPLAGVNYYRLVQFDYNGDRKILAEKAVTFNLEHAQNLIYPNPAAQQVYIKLANAKGQVTVDLVSLTGQTILAKAYNISENEEIAINLADVPKGSYILWLNKRMKNNDKKKLLVIK
ncbi:MAG: T9SS type A sorting domain-containing protein, partial [Chitinophagaceae bacterium]